MIAMNFFILCFLASLANAHFFFKYPEERGDTFLNGASQYIFPCAAVNQTASTNRTIWPLTGGSLALDLHHPWTYVFVNLGFGTNPPSFNISLTPNFLNVTGNGTFCFPKLVLPAGVTPVDGQNASIQVVTSGRSGSALYNCADITFRSNAAILNGGACVNSSNVAATVVTQASSSTVANNSAATTSGTTSAGGSNRRVDSTSVALVGILSVALAFWV